MARNGTGTYSLPNPAFVAGTTISSTSVNGDLSDIASALTQSISSDGQTIITGQLKFGSGTAAAPSHTFASDLTTGMYYVGTKKLGFSAGGTAAVFIDQNNVGSGQTGNQIYLANTAILNPVGMVIDFAAATPPAGWLICNAQVVAQATYPELFQIIGSTWNTGGEGAGNFRLPDCRGRASYGQDSGGSARITVAGGNFDGTVLGGAGGAQNQTLAVTQIPSHTHSGTTGLENQAHNHSYNGAASGAESQVGGGPSTGTIISGQTTGNENQNHDHNFTTGGTGGGLSHPILGPAIIFNKIIFAGRP